MKDRGSRRLTLSTARAALTNPVHMAVKRQDSIGVAPRDQERGVAERQRGAGRIERFEGRRWCDRGRMLVMGFSSLQARLFERVGLVSEPSCSCGMRNWIK
jgi:hypothetical protein